MPERTYAAAMDANQCRVLYIDDRFPGEKWVSRGSVTALSDPNHPYRGMAIPPELQPNVDALLSVFTQVYLCNSGRTFSSKLAELSEASMLECNPILALFDIAPDLRHDMSPMGRNRKTTSTSSQSDTESPPLQPLHRTFTFTSESDESYGLQLLSQIASDLQVQDNGQLVVPIAITRSRAEDVPVTPNEPLESILEYPMGRRKSTISVMSRKPSPGDPQLMVRSLDAGAVDVVISGLDQARVVSLLGHAYKAYKTAKRVQSSFLASKKMRRQSWVGVEEQKPYSYLRESMVRKLMSRICDPDAVVDETHIPEMSIEEDRKSVIRESVGKWGFCAHDFSEDELVYAAVCMLHHAVEMKELEKWRLSFDELIVFVQAARSAYNSFVIYHNFRHAIDVLQSVFYFLLQINALPRYPRNGLETNVDNSERQTVASLLKPFEAMTLLISAIGHDVGHPGVNNMFLVKLSAPLAQLYNDQSVLEAFHCAAYSQILRQHWPAAFEDKGLRKLLISSILATDMGIHSDYMQQLGHLQSKFSDSKSVDGWSPKDMEQARVLSCGLLIKCADISNVARPWSVAERWTNLLQEEFANQGQMEREVGMESCLFGGPPELGNMLKLANSQIGFMGLFAFPLFDGVADVFPQMTFAPEEISKNKAIWFSRAEQEKQKEMLKREAQLPEGLISPRTQPPTVQRVQGPGPPGYFATSALRDEVSPYRRKTDTPSPGTNDVTKEGSGQYVPSTDPSLATEKSSTENSSGASPGASQPAPSVSNNVTSLGGTYDGSSSGQGTLTPSIPSNGGSSENQRPGTGGSTVATSAVSSAAPESKATPKWYAPPKLQLKLPSRGDESRSSAPAALPLYTRRSQSHLSYVAERSTPSTPLGVTSASPQMQKASPMGQGSEHNSSRAGTATESTISTSGAQTDADRNQDPKANAVSNERNYRGKNHFETAILHQTGNSDVKNQSCPTTTLNNGTVKAMPRKRSRLKLAFWKKSKATECEE